jgi:DNA-binding NarL/FixJ family response regulator
MVRAIILADTAVQRWGIGAILRADAITVVAEVAAPQEVLDALPGASADVIVVSLHDTGDASTAAVVCSLRHRDDRAGILGVGRAGDAPLARRLAMRQAEGLGCILEDSLAEPQALVEAVRRVAAGVRVTDPRALRDDPGPDGLLTRAQADVMDLVAAGLTNRAIAARLHIAERTVEAHVSAALRRLGIDDDGTRHRRVALALRWRASFGPPLDAGHAA